MRLELRRQSVMRPIRLSHHQQARGVLVDPMHHTGALFTPHTRQVVAEVMQQGVHQCPGRCPWRRVDHHPGRFVDHRKIVILEHDVQRNIFRADMAVRSLSHAHFEDIAFPHHALGTHQHACPRYTAVLDQPHQPRARKMRFLWHVARQRLIKARGWIWPDDDLDGAAGHGRQNDS